MKTIVPTIHEFFAFARSIEGEPLRTLHHRKQFQITVVSDAVIEITPGTRSPRAATRDRIANILGKLRESGSFRPGHYTDESFNASYVLALVKLWQDRT